MFDDDVEIRAGPANEVRLAVAAEFAVGLKERAHWISIIMSEATQSQADLACHDCDEKGRKQSDRGRAVVAMTCVRPVEEFRSDAAAARRIALRGSSSATQLCIMRRLASVVPLN